MTSEKPSQLRAIPPLSIPQPVIDLRTEAGQPETRDEGVRCPGCNCRRCPVKKTWHSGKNTFKRRECRHCGTTFRTREETVATE